MSNNKGRVETTKNSQPTQKNKTPQGKVKTLKEAKERREAREKEYRNFRIKALKRRAARMGIAEDKIPELVEKLIAQLDAPKEYHILVLFNEKDSKMFYEALQNGKIKYKYCGKYFASFEGGKDIVDKIRELAPENAKIHLYAKKAEPILKAPDKPKQKKPTNNTSEAKKAAETARKRLNVEVRAKHKKGHGKTAAKNRKYARSKTLAYKAKKRANKVVSKKDNALKQAA